MTRPVPNYPRYKVSENGQITGPQGKVLRLCVNKYGYPTVKLSPEKSSLSVSRIVAMAFLPPSTNPRATEVDHMDGDKTNNCISNLRWATRSQNLCWRLRQDSIIPGLTLTPSGRFSVVVQCDQQRRRGTFANFDEAIACRNAWACELQGIFAWIPDQETIDAARDRYGALH